MHQQLISEQKRYKLYSKRVLPMDQQPKCNQNQREGTTRRGNAEQQSQISTKKKMQYISNQEFIFLFSFNFKGIGGYQPITTTQRLAKIHGSYNAIRTSRS